MATAPHTKEIFLKALSMGQTERTAFLNDVCSDADVRKEVDGLLAAYGRAGQFLEPPPPPSRGSGSADLYRQTPGGPERRVGRYIILERLGEGGFGVVYRAEQTEPVRRYAALKIVKLGMDTQEVLKRFNAERQAVAMMDHPNIATIYDGGVTDGGRPYFVMELVIGEPITDYCDKRQLGVIERLGLFLPVCRAVQHAHQKGVVHRDLKPSNVIITIRDGQAVPKIIDFGIAKALHTPLTDASMMTSRGQFIGTPQYMSPEQTRLDGGHADTRSDVFSLGVLLYELLTGSTPVDETTLRGKDFAELPSQIAGKRGLTPPRLASELVGDLDWVVMKAIEKDPAARYQTVDALIEDIERHLKHEPVTAGPPSKVFALKKFAKRHKAWFWAGSVVGATVLLGSAVLLASWLHARTTEQELRAELDQAKKSIADLERRLEQQRK
jgi:eukaryotic-like serine/threonine-protein kinase